MDKRHTESERSAPASDQQASLAENESQASLREFLVDRYGDLKRRLAYRLGSPERAEEALQDTYLRLGSVAPAVGLVRDPAAYLFRAALNNALNRRRAETQLLSAKDIASLLHIADDAPDALRVIEGRSDLEKLTQAISRLPSRSREILLAARLEGSSRKEIADRFGISVSMVEKELKRAQEQCAAFFRRRMRP